MCGVFRDGRWQFDFNHDGKLDHPLLFGHAKDTVVTGDIDGDGRCDIGVCQTMSDGRLQWQFALAGDDQTFAVDDPQKLIFGRSTGTPVLADVDGDGRCDLGVVTRSENHAKLLWSFDTDRDGNSNSDVLFGDSDTTPVIGRWRGKVRAHAGFVVTGEKAVNGDPDWYLSSEDFPIVTTVSGDNSSQAATHPVPLVDNADQLQKVDFGYDTDHFIVGDWNADGHDDTGNVRSQASGDGRSLNWQLNLNADGLPAREFQHMGLPGDQPVVLSGRRMSHSE